MTLDILVGGKNEWSVSNSTRDIFPLVYHELEQGQGGSRFPLFYKFSKGKKIPIRDIKPLTDELYDIKSELYPLPLPVISWYHQELEMAYRNANGAIMTFNIWAYGANEQGLFVDCDDKREYYLELLPGTPYFEKFQSLAPVGKHADKVDRIAQGWKSAHLVWEKVMEKMISITYDAQERKKTIQAM